MQSRVIFVHIVPVSSAFVLCCMSQALSMWVLKNVLYEHMDVVDIWTCCEQ